MKTLSIKLDKTTESLFNDLWWAYNEMNNLKMTKTEIVKYAIYVLHKFECGELIETEKIRD